jgi:hypothetical protein
LAEIDQELDDAMEAVEVKSRDIEEALTNLDAGGDVEADAGDSRPEPESQE